MGIKYFLKPGPLNSPRPFIFITTPNVEKVTLKILSVQYAKKFKQEIAIIDFYAFTGASIT